MNVDVNSQDIRAILASNGRLAVAVETLDDDTDLFSAGLDSLAIVNVLMAIEERFDVEFPEHLLSRKSFSSIRALTRAVDELRGEQATT